jgi:aliphatic nitrilase
MADTFPRFNVAAVQASAILFDREKTIDKAVRCIEEAADQGAVIIGFPETFIPGEPEIWYLAKRNSNPLHRQGKFFTEFVKNSVRIPSPATDRLCQAARKAHAYVVIGVSEIDHLFPGTLYLSQLFISDAGEIIGVHRKLVSTTYEKFVFSPGDGSYLNVYDTSYGKLSGMSCGEHAHGLFKYALLAMGSQIHVASWAPFPDRMSNQVQRDSVDFRVRQFAHEGKIFIINSCAVTSKQNIDFCCDTQEEKDFFVENTGGGSSIIGPSGEYLAGPLKEGEGIVAAEICLEDALPGKQVHNVLGHYTRWDIFSLNFNRERLHPFKGLSAHGNGAAEPASELQKIRRELQEMGNKVDGLMDELHQFVPSRFGAGVGKR